MECRKVWKTFFMNGLGQIEINIYFYNITTKLQCTRTVSNYYRILYWINRKLSE